MSLILFYDTETTGFPKKGQPLEEQPYIVQLAAEVLDEETGKIIHQLSLVINWKIDIPPETSAIHGWTTEMVKRVGISPSRAIDAFLSIARLCDKKVGHNEQFDDQMLKFALQHSHPIVPYFWESMPSFCTMEAMRDTCQIPPTGKMKAAGFTHYKSPKLSEAYRHCFGEDFDGAHNAMADVQACRKVWQWLQKQQ